MHIDPDTGLAFNFQQNTILKKKGKNSEWESGWGEGDEEGVRQKTEINPHLHCQKSIGNILKQKSNISSMRMLFRKAELNTRISRKKMFQVVADG